QAAAGARPTGPGPAEFAIPVVPLEPATAAPETPSAAPAPAQESVPSSAPPNEVDLSDEWEAMVREVAEPHAAVAEREPDASEQVPQEAESSQPAPPPFEFDETPAAEPQESPPREVELTAKQASAPGHSGRETTREYVKDRAAEVEGLESPGREPQASAPASAAETALATDSSALPEAVPQMTAESLNELAEVFQDFRAELGEMDEGEN